MVQRGIYNLISRYGLRLVLLLSICGAGEAQPVTQGREFHETYDIAPQGTVTVNTSSGYIRVTSWNENKVKVDAVKRGRNEEEINQVQIQVNATANRIEIRTVYPRSRTNVSVDYDLKVPSSVILGSITSISGDVTLTGPISSATANSTSGNVTARNITESANLSSTSGNVTAEKIGGELKGTSISGNVMASDVGSRLIAQSTSGNVNAIEVRDDASASTSSGSVRLEKIGGRASGHSLSGSVSISIVSGDVQADTLSDNVTITGVRGRAMATAVSGNVTIRQVDEGARATSVSGSVALIDVKGRIEVNSTSGSVSLSNVDSRDVSAKAVNGDVRFTGKLYENGRYVFESFNSNVILFLPPDSQFRLIASNRNGSINTEFPLQVSGLTGQRGLVTGTVGKGGAEVRASTFNGTIYIKKGNR